MNLLNYNEEDVVILWDVIDRDDVSMCESSS